MRVGGMMCGEGVKAMSCAALLLAALCVNAGGQATDTAELFGRVERAFREKEPKWKIESASVSREPNIPTQSIVFRSGRTQASVQLVVWHKAEVARDAFAGVAIATSNIRGKGGVRRRLPNLGDEAYVWTNRGSGAWPLLKFRRGGVLVTVFAPTTATAGRFARHVAEQIDGSGRLLNKE